MQVSRNWTQMQWKKKLVCRMAKIIIEDIDYSTGRQVAGPRNKNSYNTKAKTCKAARMNCV